MPDVSFNNLAVMLAVAFLSRLVLGLAPRVRTPGVVVEIILGIAIGPSVLGWVEVDQPVEILAVVGMAFLLFSSGLEIELQNLRGRLLGLAALGLVASVVLGLSAGYVLDAVGLITNPLLVGVTLVATSLGLVIPVLREGGLSAGRFGQLVIVGATLGDFTAVLLLSLLFSRDASGTGTKFVLLGVFVLLLVVIAMSSSTPSATGSSSRSSSSPVASASTWERCVTMVRRSCSCPSSSPRWSWPAAGLRSCIAARSAAVAPRRPPVCSKLRRCPSSSLLR